MQQRKNNDKHHHTPKGSPFTRNTYMVVAAISLKEIFLFELDFCVLTLMIISVDYLP